MTDLITHEIYGIKCDNPECGWQDLTAKFIPEHWINVPCPNCGSNLYTPEAHKQTMALIEMANAINKLSDTILTEEQKQHLQSQPRLQFEVQHNANGLIDGLNFKGIKGDTSPIHFIHDPEYNTYFFDTPEQWKSAMHDYDFLEKYCDDGWSESVENVIAGIIPAGVLRNDDEESDDWEEEYDFYRRHATHAAEQHNRTERPDDIENYHSQSTGEYWGDWDYRCEYKFEVINQ